MKLQEFLNNKRFLTEKSLNRVRIMYVQHATGTITGFRGAHDCGNGAQINRKENAGRNSVLKSMLLSKGYGVTNVKGSWFENGDQEVAEASFYVVDLKDTGNLKKDLITFGGKFDQDAITYADAGGDYYAISTNKCPDSWPGFGKIGKEDKLGKPKFGKTGINGFSRVGNRAFVFESVPMDHIFEVTTKLSLPPTQIRSVTRIFEGYPDKQSILDIGKLYE